MKEYEKFVKSAENIHGGKYDYTKAFYQGADKNLTIVCHKHGAFYMTPTQHLRGAGCPSCHREKQADVTKNIGKRNEQLERNNDVLTELNLQLNDECGVLRQCNLLYVTSVNELNKALEVACTLLSKKGIKIPESVARACQNQLDLCDQADSMHSGFLERVEAAAADKDVSVGVGFNEFIANLNKMKPE